MIQIQQKEDCVGCNACVQICPKQCISMHEDEQGFLYPRVDIDACIRCNLCEKVCPVINQSKPKSPHNTYAAKNLDEKVRAQSSSGGVFYALAKYVIERGGVVFGAKFNEQWGVEHVAAETIEEVNALMGSKYVQSNIGSTFRQAEQHLKQGRYVLFSGTPCQIAGLRKFLRCDYSGLLTVEVICHGVPSPKIWRDYVNELARPTGAPAGKNTVFQSLNETPVIAGISFRDKRHGWEKYGFSVRYASATNGSGQNSVFQSVNHSKGNETFEIFDRNIFMKAFLENYILRPSCFSCPARCGKSHADISIGDFWGIQTMHPDLHDPSGVSLVIALSDIGQEVLKECGVSTAPVSYSHALVGNPALEHSLAKPAAYDKFWRKYAKRGFSDAMRFVAKQKKPLSYRIQNKIRRILPAGLKQSLKKLLQR